jgi:hypothetical protein
MSGINPTIHLSIDSFTYEDQRSITPAPHSSGPGGAPFRVCQELD